MRVDDLIPTPEISAARVEKQTLWQLRVCLSLLYTSVLLSSFALSFGSKQLPLVWLIGLVHFGVLALLTRGTFDLPRLFTIAVALSLLTFETAAFHSSFSATSLIYIALIYAPLALTAPFLAADSFSVIWRHVSILAAIITVCGLVQVAGQFLAGGLFIDPLHQLPSSLLLDGYNTTYPIAWGQTLMKPNGMFLLEPSFFSQIVALGLVSEMVFFRRKWLMILFVVGLGASFSGTGFLMLVPALLFIGSARMVLVFTTLALVLAAVIFSLGYGDIYMARATETGDSGSSGNMRFVAPYQDMWDGWESKTSDFLFGKGAGATQRMSAGSDANFGPVSKVGVEYGALGLAAFTAVWVALFWGLALPRGITIAMLIFYFLGSGSFLQPFSVFMLWPLTAGFLRAKPDELIPGRAAPPVSASAPNWFSPSTPRT